jgi:hypothetical protein
MNSLANQLGSSFILTCLVHRLRRRRDRQEKSTIQNDLHVKKTGLLARSLLPSFPPSLYSPTSVAPAAAANGILLRGLRLYAAVVIRPLGSPHPLGWDMNDALGNAAVQ